MKKLMIALAAAATAVGLHAAPGGFISGTAFETDDGGNSWASETGLNAAYWTASTGATVAPGDSAYGETIGRPYGGKIGSTQIMEVKTTLGTPIVHKVLDSGSQKIGTGLYFDGLVNFTVFDYGDTPAADNAKIAVYLQMGNENDESVTNFVVRAANGNYVCGGGAADIKEGWHRLTIKAIENVYATAGSACVGFVVFVDGSMVACSEAKIKDESSLTLNAAEFNKDGGLFLSLGGASIEIAEVAFDGQGKLDELAFVTTAPFPDAGDKEGYYVSFDTEKLASITIGEETFTTSPAKIIGVLPTSGKVTISWVGKGNYMDGSKEYDITTSGSTITIADSDLTAAAALFGTTKYETLEAALAVANASATDGTLTLLADGEDIRIKNDDHENVVITLDLNGKIVTKNENDYAINVTTPAVIGGTAGIVSDGVCAGGALTINCGTFDGAVTIDGGTITIPATSTAKFSVLKNTTEDDACTLTAPAGYKFVRDGSGDYWVLDMIAAAKIGEVKYATLEAAIEAAQNGDMVEIIDDLTTTKSISIEGNGPANYAITIKNEGHKVTVPDLTSGSSKPAYYADYGFLVNGAKVTFTGNGTYEKAAGAGSFLQGGAGSTSGGYSITAAEAQIVIESGTFKGGTKGCPSNLFTTKWGSITVNGGTFVNLRSDAGRCVRGEGSDTKAVTVTINAGDFTCDASYVGSGEYRACPVDDKNGKPNTTISIPATSTAVFTCHADNAAYMQKFCADGYKLALNDADPARYVVTQMETWNVTVAAELGANVLTLTASPTSLREDATDKTITLTATFADGYELDYFTTNDVAITGNTFTLTESVEVNAVAKSTGGQPLPPDTPAPIPGVEPTATKEQAQAAADQMDVAGATAAGVEQATWNGYFTKTVSQAVPGESAWKVTAELNETVVAAPTAGDIVTKLDQIGDSGLEVSVCKGLWYAVDQGSTVGLGTKSDAVKATDTKMTLPLTKSGNARFYKVLVTVDQPK